MKKLNALLMIALAAGTFTACHNSGNGSTAATDSAGRVKDTAMNLKKDSTLVTMDDEKFAMDAANGGMTEIALSKLAETKATTKQIKDFAAMMVMDHGKAGDELKGIAKMKQIVLPDSISMDSKRAVDDMSKLSGSGFDKAYVNRMVEDHTNTLSMFQGASKKLTDKDLKTFCDKTIPVVQAHLTKIKAIETNMK